MSGIKRALCRVCVRTRLHGPHACLALQMKLCMNTLISAPLGWSGAWLWISILHSSLAAPPDAPPDTKENQLSVCVSVYQEALHGSKEGASFTRPLYLKGIDRLYVLSELYKRGYNECVRQLSEATKDFLASRYQSSCEHQPPRTHMSCEAKWHDNSSVQSPIYSTVGPLTNTHRQQTHINGTT